MIEVLQSLPFRSSKDLSVPVSANSVLPTENQTAAGGRIVVTKTFAPGFIEGAVNYDVEGYTTQQGQIRNFVDLQSSYNPIELVADYLKNTIYDTLPSQSVPFFSYWYDVVNVYSVPAVKTEIGTKDLYRDFSDSVGFLMLHNLSPNSVAAANIAGAGIKTYNRTIESIIPDDIRTAMDAAFTDANGPYVDNIGTVAGTAAPTTAHGTRLIADLSNTTRYTATSSAYLSNLINSYAQLMYLSPLYTTITQAAQLSTTPFFSAIIEEASVVVDKLGNKVSIDSGWLEQSMLSAYPQE